MSGGDGTLNGNQADFVQVTTRRTSCTTKTVQVQRWQAAQGHQPRYGQVVQEQIRGYCEMSECEEETSAALCRRQVFRVKGDGAIAEHEHFFEGLLLLKDSHIRSSQASTSIYNRWMHDLRADCEVSPYQYHIVSFQRSTLPAVHSEVSPTYLSSGEVARVRHLCSQFFSLIPRSHAYPLNLVSASGVHGVCQ